METDYEPFGAEWEAAVTQMTKKHIIGLLREVGISKEERIQHIEELKAAIWVLLHHIPETPDMEPIRDKCKACMNLIYKKL